MSKKYYLHLEIYAISSTSSESATVFGYSVSDGTSNADILGPDPDMHNGLWGNDSSREGDDCPTMTKHQNIKDLHHTLPYL